MSLCKVMFLPLKKAVSVKDGTTLLEAAGRAGIVINNVCGGDGICGRCRMIVKQGKVRGEATALLTRDEVQQGYVLACLTFVEENLTVEIPEETRAGERVVVDEDAQRFRAIQPGIKAREFTRSSVVSKVFLKMDKPTLEDNMADCQRLQRAVTKATGIATMQVGLKVVRRLPELLRESGFAVTVTIGRRRDIAEIMDVEPGDVSARNYIAVVDIGTSTIVLHLVDAVSTATVDAQACFNSQYVYGREVTARIMAAEKKGVESLQTMLVEDINGLLSTVAKRSGVALKDVNAVVCSGNTTMMHFLLGFPAGNIRRNPYVPVSVESAPFRAVEVGIRINPRGLLFTIPGISGWVGGDLTAGILATGMNEMDGIAMLIDVGTNGEIVVGNREWLVTSSASTGPALEGASVECGMMAEKGAIEKVSAENGKLRFKVIGGGKPKGICGSGIIDLIAVLLENGIIDRSGRLIDGSHAGVKMKDGRGTFQIATGLRLTQDDIDNVITAKAAVFAATKIMLDRLNLRFSDLSVVFLAGGFGSYIDRENAVKIGLLPDLPLSKIKYVGNTSIWGATLAALSHDAFETLRAIRRQTTYYDLMGARDYVDQFQQARFLPHTNVELFPSVREGHKGTKSRRGHKGS